MREDRGYFWAVFSIHHSPLAPFVFSGFAFGLFILIGGVLFGSIPIVILGVVVMVVWMLLLIAISLLVDEGVNWLDKKLEPRPGHQDAGAFQVDPAGHPTRMDRTYHNPYWTGNAGAPGRPEPVVCAVCGGRLFVGRPSCPHCSAPVAEAER